MREQESSEIGRLRRSKGFRDGISRTKQTLVCTDRNWRGLREVRKPGVPGVIATVPGKVRQQGLALGRQVRVRGNAPQRTADEHIDPKVGVALIFDHELDGFGFLPRQAGDYLNDLVGVSVIKRDRIYGALRPFRRSTPCGRYLGSKSEPVPVPVNVDGAHDVLVPRTDTEQHISYVGHETSLEARDGRQWRSDPV